MSMNINPSLIKLKQEPVLLQPTTVAPSATDVEPVVLSTTGNVSPDQMLGLMATQSANNGVTINTDKQNQAKLDNAKALLAEAHEALQNNTDPTKTEELQKAVDKALENYQKVLKELADASYLETKTTVEETPATRAGGTVRTETEEIYENGKLALKIVKEYDSNNNVVKVVETSYRYEEDDGGLFAEEERTYNEKGLLVQSHYIQYVSGRPHWIHDTKYGYDDNGVEISSYREEYYYSKNDGAYKLSAVHEWGCDKEGNKLIGIDGQPIDGRITYPGHKGMALTDTGYVLGYGEDGKSLCIIPAYEEIVGDVARYYDANDNIIAEQFHDGNMETPDNAIFYIRDEAGQVIKEEAYLFTERYEGDVVEKRSSTYTYNADGSYTRELVITNFADNTKVTYVEEYNANGLITKKTIITYDENGNVVRKKTTEGRYVKETPIDPLINPEEMDISDQDATKLLSGLSTSVSLSGWIRSGSKDPRTAIYTAMLSMMDQIDSLAGKLKAMGYDSAKVDSAATTLRNYYSALLNTVYDDDNKLQKKGETCATNFTYRDASGKVQSGSSNFRHYAFGLEKNANEKVGAGSESKSGIVLLENTGVNHSYKIAVDMKTVANMLIEFFNAL